MNKASKKEKSKLIKAINKLPEETIKHLPRKYFIGLYLDKENEKEVIRIQRDRRDHHFHVFNIPNGANKIAIRCIEDRGITNFYYEGFNYEVFM